MHLKPELENRLEQLGNQLQNPPADPDAIQQIGEDYAYLESELHDAMAEWEAEHARLIGS